MPAGINKQLLIDLTGVEVVGANLELLDFLPTHSFVVRLVDLASQALLELLDSPVESVDFCVESKYICAVA